MVPVIYLREISGIERLSAAEERRLYRRVKKGDRKAREMLVRSLLTLVTTLSRYYTGRGVARDDLIAEGNLSLMRALEQYECRDDALFRTYATCWVKQGMKKAIANQGRAIRLPHYIVVRVGKWNRTAARLGSKFGREPAVEEIAKALGYAPKEADTVLKAAKILGMEADRGVLVDRRSRRPIDILIEREEPETEAREAPERLKCLTPREVTILFMRYGIAPYAAMGQPEVGRELGISKQRVHQIESRAVQKLKSVQIWKESGPCLSGSSSVT